MITEEKYRVIYEHFSEGIVVVQDGYIVFLNPKIMDLTGYTWKELTQWPVQKFLHPDDKKIADEICGYTEEDEEKTFIHKFKIMAKDKTSREMNIKINKVRWEGNPALLVFVAEPARQSLAVGK